MATRRRTDLCSTCHMAIEQRFDRTWQHTLLGSSCPTPTPSTAARAEERLAERIGPERAAAARDRFEAFRLRNAGLPPIEWS